MTNLHDSLIGEGYQLAYTFTPRKYDCNISMDGKNVPFSKEGDAEMIMRMAGKSLDDGVVSDVRVIKLSEAFSDETFDESVKNRNLVYIKNTSAFSNHGLKAVVAHRVLDAQGTTTHFSV